MPTAAVPYLSQAWLDECRRLWAEMPERPAASASIQYVIGDVDAEGSAVRYWVLFEDGRITASELGTLEDPQVTLSMPHTLSVAIVRGEVDSNEAYAAGEIGFGGDMRVLMGMWPILWPSPTRRIGPAPRYRAVRERILEITEFPSR